MIAYFTSRYDSIQIMKDILNGILY
jgi:hypothetical protein